MHFGLPGITGHVFFLAFTIFEISPGDVLIIKTLLESIRSSSEDDLVEKEPCWED